MHLSFQNELLHYMQLAKTMRDQIIFVLFQFFRPLIIVLVTVWHIVC